MVVKVAHRHGMHGVAMQKHVLDHISVLGVGVPLVNYATACKNYVLWRDDQGVDSHPGDDDAGDAAVREVQQQVIPQLQALRALAPDASSLAPRPTADVDCFWGVAGVPNTLAAIVVDKLMLRVPASAMCAVVERERRAGDVEVTVERVLVNLNALNKNFDITGADVQTLVSMGLKKQNPHVKEMN